MSQLNWCEKDYAQHPNIAEFWNTITSMSFIAIAAFGLCFNKLKVQYMYSYCILGLIGTASIMFHATLTDINRLFDEWSIALFIFYFLDQIVIVKRKWLGAFFFLELVLGIYLPTVHCICLIVEALTGYLYLYVTLDPNVSLFTRLEIDKLKTTFICALIVWLLDFTWTCQWVNWHSLWHLLSSISGYYLCFIFTTIKAVSHGKEEIRVSYLGYLPVLSIKT